MKRNHGNQHKSRKGDLMAALRGARYWLAHGYGSGARQALREYRKEYALVPASTKRRWKCGR
jgi:hypothetical protein